ncbi:formylmethanofuran dehydrogenase subunit A [Limnoglobus roseus]|uniref:Formylmethanofuran dehydrogenase subunit A n=1 Tax=Limnoglobus roseus TaxID=2598579 RepID=A0A5C1APL6_9BACT|nr:formylmethanofuran dehydrogenase subunit A [Limnoglobus roseus]QEL19966.1 formylmethanofuran dehydrogenase subunit A [Limnoglobus roseus]
MLRIQGGTVYDPANGVNGVVKNIVLDGGKVVTSGEGGRTIDATGMIVFPGGVDVHTHVAGAGLNFARSMIPEEHRQSSPILRSRTKRAGIGGPTPTSFATGYLYAGMGWTTVNEAAVPMLTAKRTHDELHDTPIVDKACCVLMGNNELILDLLERGEHERAKQVVAWYLWAAKGYGIKVVNAGGVAAWKWGKDAKKLTDVVEGYHSLTPGAIIASLARIIDELNLPHPMHLHCNNLGAPGNVGTTLETMKTLESHRAHLAHLQYHAYGGDDWESIRSDAPAIANYFNAHKNLTTDAGAVLFGNAITLSADGPWQYLLYQLTGKKWGNIDVENETGCGVVPYVYREKNIVNAVQWATGLELLLLIDDPWRVALTTDHPNGTSFWRYPEILQLLMDASFRKEEFAKLPEKARSRTCLADLTREYTLYEIAILTSAGPARTLGLSQKGHLGVGADADVAIYNAHKNAATMFSHPRYVIKGGEIVVEDGDIRTTPESRGFITKPSFDPAIEDYLRPLFQSQYTVAFENYPVEMARIPRPIVREV